MQWWMLLLSFFIYCVCAFLTYSDEMRKKPWYIPVAVALGMAVSTVWFFTVRWLDDKQRVPRPTTRSVWVTTGV